MTVVRLCLLGALEITFLSRFPVAEIASAGFDAQPVASSTSIPHAAVEATPDQLAGHIAALIQQLGDERYLVRQAAQSELGRIGPEAFDALTAAENDTDIEVSSRAKYLVQLIRAQWIHDSDSPQVKRILDKYELLDDTGRLAALRQLVFLPHDLGLPSLCRLMRFERSPLVSKFSALLIIGQPDAAAHSWAVRQKIIEANLAQNSGPGAQWLRAYLRFHSDPQGAAGEVDKLVDEELAGLAPFANDAQRQNALLLENRLADVLEQSLDRRDRALDLLQKLAPLVATDQESVVEFADVLVQHQAWKLIDELALRAKDTFNADPTLLYTWAQSLQAEGETEQAKALSKRAFELIGNSPENHKNMGQKLSRLGLFDAAEREYRHVIASSPQDTQLTIETQSFLGEMLHDQEHDLQAALVLQELVNAMNRDDTVLQRVKEEDGGNYPDTLRGEMHLYYSCHYAAQKKLDQQRQALDEGVKADPTNADILIGLYETSADDPVRRQHALELIHTADKGFRETIGQQPNDFTPYNMDAWLIGNTEGDYDLAIQYSQTSIELLKNVATEDELVIKPGFLDTLAHCYAGKGDFENAVKYQARAAELDPHTLQITKALAKFKKQLEHNSSETPSP
jgi:tetratricopeptide (TPR) repeat protein